MTIWIDPPIWPAHDRLWSHLVSDASYQELHRFADATGLSRRLYEGDHYDVPEERYAALVAAGAHPVSGAELVRKLQGSGLRLRKRPGERGLHRVRGARFPDGTSADVDLIAGRRIADDERIFAAMVFTRDALGQQVVVWSNRRQEWAAPGGWREPGESPAENAVREAFEETGLHLDPDLLEPVGYERFHVHGSGGMWVAGRDILQVFRARVESEAPPLVAEPGVTPPRWVPNAHFEHLCGARFWWPLAEHVIALPGA